ncbi:actin-binding protein IPP-like [Montipora foliosa]|uniref:actin-binding protein IPP-like n=1 Tax=Montipora foliosa TaxID=591990 RepID=UPI0035F1B5A9
MVVTHSEILLSKCALFREQGEFIDVRLKVGDDEFPVHRIVLAANSDYFHAMFARGMKESNQEVIELKDENISADATKIVMDAIYGGEINISDENVFEVLLAADHLQVTSVIKQCCDFLQTEFVHKKFDLQTYCRICSIADRHGLNDLKEATQREMALIYKEICENEEFLSHFDADQLSSLLSRDDLNAPSENFVFKSVMQWIKYNKEERMPVAARVIGAVRLGLVDIKDVIEELDTDEMQVIPEIHTLVYRTLIHNYRPSSRSTFALEKAKPRSMSPVLVAILPKSDIRYFDILSKTWKQLPSIPQLTEATECCCAQHVGNYLYVAAKANKDFVIYCYDIVRNTWGTLPTLPSSANQIGCLCYFEDHIYVVYQCSAPFRYNVATNHWQSIASSSAVCNLSPKTFCNKAAAVYKSCLYVLYGQGVCSYSDIYGYSIDVFVSVLFCFDPRRNVWEQKASTKTPHFGSSLVVVNNKLYVAGGTCSLSKQNPPKPAGSAAAIEVYNEQANTWSVVKQTHIPPNNLRAVEVGGKVFFIINCFPVDSGITVSPGEVYPAVLDGWENLGKVDGRAVLCYAPIKMENLTAETT